MFVMNIYVNKVKYKGFKKKKDFRVNCGKNINKNNFLYGKICIFISFCFNEKKYFI